MRIFQVKVVSGNKVKILPKNLQVITVLIEKNCKKPGKTKFIKKKNIQFLTFSKIST